MKKKLRAGTSLPEPCLVLDFRALQRDREDRWAHLAKPPLPPIRGALNLDPRTGQRLEG